MDNLPLFYKYRKLFKLDNERSNNILNNVIISFCVKGGSIVVGFIMVPVIMNYISPIKYGLWLTISSFVSWMSFLDIGMGNGLRNTLTCTLSKNDKQKAKVYISTTYAALSIVSLFLFFLFLIVNPLIDWRRVLGINTEIGENIHLIILVVLSSFCLQFIVQILNSVLTAVHKPALAAFIAFLGQLGILAVILVLKETIPGSLDILVWVLTFVPIIILLVASIFYYRTKLRDIAPAFDAINFKYVKSILNVGASFFIIQLGALALFQTNNFIIIKVIGPEAVTEFNVAYKLFSVITLIFIIIITPYWSAFTDAYAKEDFKWMQGSLSKLHNYFYGLSICALIIFAASSFIYESWIGNSIRISPTLSLAMMIYVIVHMWQTLHVYLINGTGKIRLQLYLVLIAAVINIPLATYLGRIWGLNGIVSANILVVGIIGVVFSLQIKKIVNKRASGIWNK